MEKYWKPKETMPIPSATTNMTKPRRRKNDFEEHLEALVAAQEGGDEGGWRAELRDYLKHRPAEVRKDMDVLKWWAVRDYYLLILVLH
jgi:hypothetical protein